MFDFDLGKKHFSNEAEFTTRFWWQIKENGWFWFKIPDDSMGSKPYDAIACRCGESYHIELKAGKNKGKVDVFNMLRPVQKYSLRLVAENWGNAIVVYYSIPHNAYYVVPFLIDTQKIEISLKSTEETL